MKKALKIIAIVVAIAGAAFAAYILIKKYVESKKVVIGNDAENYVSCSCCDEDFLSETVA
jgi:hypothetical protein